MTDFPFAIVGFDLDGTLLDTSADLAAAVNHTLDGAGCPRLAIDRVKAHIGGGGRRMLALSLAEAGRDEAGLDALYERMLAFYADNIARSEEHTSELQSLMRISYAVFCLKKKKNITRTKISNRNL